MPPKAKNAYDAYVIFSKTLSTIYSDSKEKIQNFNVFKKTNKDDSEQDKLYKKDIN